MAAMGKELDELKGNSPKPILFSKREGQQQKKRYSLPKAPGSLQGSQGVYFVPDLPKTSRENHAGNCQNW
jgi:hypothetical protein